MSKILTYNQVQRFYQEFKENLPKDDFSRYYQEFSFMKSLIAFAKKQGLEKDVFEYSKIQKEAADKLKEMGYKISIE